MRNAGSKGQQRTPQMTQSDLIVVIPWIIFCIGLLLLCIRLYRSRRSRRSSGDRLDRPPDRSGQPGNDEPGNGEPIQQRKHDVPR
jgi:hypothetical protein